MWFDEAVIYQIYPLGLCGAPLVNNGECEEEAGNHRILRILDWIDHIKSMGTSCVLFNPLFESDAHGYDTRNYNKVDRRLGTNEDFKKVCDAIHASGMKVMLDGVFNHAGRGFFAFEDVRQKKWDSRYKDWFHISFDGNTNYNDGFWYESWEGCNELVKLNLSNPEVKEYLFDAVKNWVNEYDIDGLRLDVAYCLDRQFLSELRHFTDGLKNEFVLMGETLHGDYNQWVNDNACYSVTNYECYKGIYSSFNSSNMHEIAYSLNRQFGNEQWCIYRGKHLFSFVDNHDVTRIASILENKNNLFPTRLPAIPSSIYRATPFPFQAGGSALDIPASSGVPFRSLPTPFLFSRGLLPAFPLLRCEPYDAGHIISHTLLSRRAVPRARANPMAVVAVRAPSLISCPGSVSASAFSRAWNGKCPVPAPSASCCTPCGNTWRGFFAIRRCFPILQTRAALPPTRRAQRYR